MKGILADVNIVGHLFGLVRIWESDEWKEIWRSLNLRIFTFEDLGLDDTASDLEVWKTCQSNEIILVTANRNDDGPESLESAIRQFNTATNLPVFTLANVSKMESSRSYAFRVATKILQNLLEMDGFLGTGRLFVP
ncbi:MAG: DUF5615 family PIN-like protein [Gemmataceae bacterium]|nr:DUF5615 family PIN-like protein [Gemmataceae bacterium]